MNVGWDVLPTVQELKMATHVDKTMLMFRRIRGMAKDGDVRAQAVMTEFRQATFTSTDGAMFFWKDKAEELGIA